MGEKPVATSREDIIPRESVAPLGLASVNDGYPPPAYGWYVVGILTLAYVFSFLDRQILSLLVEPMKADLHLNDTQISLLQGLAFAVCNALAGLPLGRLVDTQRRTTLVAAGIAFWSVATAACGLVRSYGALLVLRMGVGAGEAILTPAANSLIGDHFPPQKVGFPLAVYSIGIFIGGGLALVIGATVIAGAMAAGPAHVPFVGEIRPWQVVFLIVGLPGLLVALLALSLREPARKGALRRSGAPDGAGKPEAPPLREVFAFLKENRRAFISVNLFMGFSAVAGYGVAAWVPSMFIRRHGWTAVEIGHTYGLLLLVFGTAGVLMGGWLGDVMTRRHGPGGRLRIAIAVKLLTIPFIVGYTLLPDASWALLPLAISIFLPTFMNGLSPAILQQMVPNQMRGTAISISLLVVNMLGLGLGPTLIAVLNDHVFRDPNMIHLSILSVCVVMAAISLIFILIAYRPYVALVDALQQSQAEEGRPAFAPGGH
ncbi:MAG TPA: MFS transporter [Sphingopyxis sp.]|uniref:spinster family MFS transporter n=1 Tax=Sphingopyxis sp. TaxID=1908224 RepID=UPI002BC46171|nr:MFS transporter [Sphingopyxis sp.]HWW57199.1 MFS transporter [Sphingopyxis sp.]